MCCNIILHICKQLHNSVVAGKRISFSSCKSRWYPSGRFAVSNEISFGTACKRLHLPRIISKTSGFFLCGMMDEPVVNSSGKDTKPKF